MAQSADDIDAGLDTQDADTAGELTEWLQSYSHLEILGAYGRRLIDLEGQSVSAGGPNVSLSGNTSVGATSITFDTVPDGLGVGAIIAIDAYTTECELRVVTGLAAGTVTVAALRYTHASGDALLVLESSIVPSVFGIAGDGTNEWAPMQRLFYEAVALGLNIDGRKSRVDIGQPLLISTSSLTKDVWVRTDSPFAPIDNAHATYYDNAAVMVGNRTGTFTASAATNTFTTPSAHGFGVDTLISFNNPYGETLPGGITSGRLYWVKTASGTTFTISGTVGGAEYDVTVDGTGMYLQSIGTLSRVFWESFRIDLTVADVNGLLTGLQQPSWTRNMRIEMLANCTTETVGWSNGGQISYHDNVEINPSANCVGLVIGGSGHIFRGFNANGGGQGARTSGDNHAIYDIWTEQCTPCGIEIANTSRAIVIDGTWLGNTPSSSTPMLLVSGALTSYRVGVMRPSSGTGQLLISDTVRGFVIRSDTGTGEADAGSVFHGLSQEYGSAYGPRLASRSVIHATSSITTNRIAYVVYVDTTAASRTITLPTAVGWLGWTTTIVNGIGANSVIIDPTGSETINAAATLTLTAGQAATVYSNGINYIVIGNV